MPSHSSVPLSDAQKAQWIDAIGKMDDSFLPALAYQDRDDPHKRVYVAAFDGTWNDRDNVHPGETPTNPAQLEAQLSKLYNGHTLDGHYYEGVGTRENGLMKVLDGMTGSGTEERAERAFHDFQEKATQWLKEDPNAQIHVFATGFSRGSASARHFLNLVDERGVPADGGKLKYDTAAMPDENGGVKVERVYDKFLREPGTVTSSALLYDTVATGQENVVKLGIPASTRFVVHLTAIDENRPAFPLTSITGGAPREAVEGSRFLTVALPGVHSDIGGGYAEGVDKLGLYLGEQVLYKLGFDIQLGQPPYEALAEGMHQHSGAGLYFIDALEDVFKPGEGRRVLEVENAPVSEAEKPLIEQDLKESTLDGALRYIKDLESGQAPPDPNNLENFAILLEPHGDGTMTVHVSDHNIVSFDEDKGTISVHGQVVRTLGEADFAQLERGEPIFQVYSSEPDHALTSAHAGPGSTQPSDRLASIEPKQPHVEKAEALAAGPEMSQ